MTINKKLVYLPLLSICLLLLIISCSNGKVSNNSYEKISAEAAKTIIDSDEKHYLVDVRSEAEYLQEHLPSAILIPVEELEEKAKTLLPNQKVVIMVYCRSGRRSAYAADILVRLGYSRVYDIGGIIDWPYDTIKGE